MKKIFSIFILILISVSLYSCSSSTKITRISDMYRTYYEIFPGAFSDSNDDGIGDLQGIINKFDYINDGSDNSKTSLGVNGIWLMPIMKSPSYHKYDVIDYKSIDSRYGDLDTFDKLANLCKERDVNLIIDLVLNHTSSSNPWFKEAKKALENGDYNNKYVKYYSIVTSANKTSGHKWVHLVGDYYYEANFSDDMPELNMDNPEVRDEIVSIIKFWFDHGVGGFRLDAVKYIYIDNQEKNIEFLQWFMDEVKKIKKDAYVVGEDWSSPIEIQNYYKSINCFDFGMSGATGNVANAAKGIDTVNTYIKNLISYRSTVLKNNENAILNPFISNHDQNRSAGFLDPNTGTLQMAANMYILSPGNPFIYYGEEIGMRGSGQDENKRLAMLWGDDDTVKDPNGSNYPASSQINGTVESQMDDENSILSHYRELIKIRKICPEIARGEYTNLNIVDNNDVGGFVAKYNDSSVAVIHCPSIVSVSIDLSKYTDVNFSKIVATLGTNGKATLKGTILTVPAMSSVVLK